MKLKTDGFFVCVELDDRFEYQEVQTAGSISLFAIRVNLFHP